MTQLGGTVLLGGEVELPVLGLGVFRSPVGKTTRQAVSAALEAGYRHIDTAAIYQNETDVGEAFRESGLGRDEVFITTKLWNDGHGYEQALQAFKQSKSKLGLDRVDLFLIHWPVPDLRLETWRAMEHLLDEGEVRAIGVSNYMVRHLEELLAHASHPPVVNQIELSPYNYRSRQEVVEYCAQHGITIEAYSPLTKGQKLNDPMLGRVGRPYGKTAAQVLIRWAIDKGFVVIPKSTNSYRIAQNGDVFDFELSSEDLEQLDDLDENLVTGWDPTGAP
jgi:diketogulonate reductase-like aldo/keto reductase